MLILAQNYVQNGTKISKKVTGKKMDPQIGFETVKQTGHCHFCTLAPKNGAAHSLWHLDII